MNSPNVPTWLGRLEQWQASHRPEYLQRLAAGVAPNEVADFPPELAALYRWRNGQSNSGDSFLLRHWFMPLKQVREQRKDIAQARDEEDFDQAWWSDQWFPFLDDGQGNLTCLDAASGKVLLYINDTEERNDLAPSLAVFFTTVVESLEAGHWRIDDEGRAVLANPEAFTALLKSRGVCFDAYGY